MKKLLAVALTLILVMTATVIPCEAAALKEDMSFGHISYHKDFYEKHKEAVDRTARAMYNLEREINLYDCMIPYEEASTLYQTVVRTHPELFYASSRYSMRVTQNDNGEKMLYALKVHWGKMLVNDDGTPVLDESGKQREELYTDEQVIQMRDEFRRKAQWYLDKVDDGMTDFQKALILHDELVLNGSYLISGEIYDFMVHNHGKCYGYSECYAYLLAQVGVDSEIVESDAMFHQWNKVKIDGAYYHVDVTWDDPEPDKPGQVRHTFFLLSDSAAENMTGHKHYGYESDYPSLDTRYDNRRYHTFNAQMCYVGNLLYAVDGTAEKALGTYDLMSDSFTPVYDFSGEYWNAGDGYVWSGMYMSLETCDGYLYMNTADKVMLYDTESGLMTQFAPNNYGRDFYGLRVTDGRLFGILADNPNQTGTQVYIGECLRRESPVTEPITTEPVTEPITTEPITEPITTEPVTEPITTEPVTEPVTEPPVEDVYVVAGEPTELFGIVWDGTGEVNRMTKDGDAYTKTYTVETAIENVQLKVVKNGLDWFGDETGNSVTFNLIGAGDFTVTFVPQTQEITVSGDIVEFVTAPCPSEIYAFGNGEGSWLCGAEWDAADMQNAMNMVADDVYEISYEHVTAGQNRRVQFGVDGSTLHFFGGTFAESGAVTDAVYKGGAITFDTPYALQTVKLQLDLRSFDFASKSGATFTVTVIPEEQPPLMGDLDGDGALTIADATLLQRALAEYEPLTEAQTALADLNGDSEITVRDLTYLQRSLAELL